jgi:hypothetical protein
MKFSVADVGTAKCRIKNRIGMNALLGFIVSTTIGEKVLLNRVPTLLVLSSCIVPVVKRPLSVSYGLICVRRIKIK